MFGSGRGQKSMRAYKGLRLIRFQEELFSIIKADVGNAAGTSLCNNFDDFSVQDENQISFLVDEILHRAVCVVVPPSRGKSSLEQIIILFFLEGHGC